MTVDNLNIMAPRATTAVRCCTVILLLVVSLRNITAQDGSPPTSVLIAIEQPLSAGRSYEITCHAVGWATPPKITWWLGDHSQLTGRERLLISETGSKTVSVLLLTPSPEDNGQTLKCQAEGPSGTQETSVNLVVYYSPTVTMYVEPPLRPDDIRVGSDVTLRCHVQSNPLPTQVVMMFEGHLLRGQGSIGGLDELLPLDLEAINRTQSGDYSCVASNAVGESESPPLRLTVKYKAACQSEQPLVYATPLGEVVEMDCEVDAVPPPERYRWMFSRAMDADGEAEPAQWRVRGPNGERISYIEWASGVSRRTYQPKTDTDYGTFYCSAKNALGLQEEPCIFHVVPPGMPNRPSNCSTRNETINSFVVQCPIATDGGFRQSYHLEVFDYYTGHIIFNETQSSPVFLVGGVRPNQPLTMRIAALSPRGRSEWVTSNIFAMGPPPTTDITIDDHEKRK